MKIGKNIHERLSELYRMRGESPTFKSFCTAIVKERMEQPSDPLAIIPIGEEESRVAANLPAGAVTQLKSWAGRLGVPADDVFNSIMSEHLEGVGMSRSGGAHFHVVKAAQARLNRSSGFDLE